MAEPLRAPVSDPPDHASLRQVTTFDLRLTCHTGLHIGAGKNPSLVGSDLPVMRDSAGQPLIPGSSLRGVLRASATSLLEGLGISTESPPPPPNPGPNAGSPPPTLSSAWKRWSWIERLFGRIGGKNDLSFASRVHFSDLRCQAPGPVAVELRDGVGIDREIRTASNSVKYNLEVVPAGTVFQGRVRLKNTSDADLGLIGQTLWMLDEGLITLGGKSARGLGWMEVRVSEPRQRTAGDILYAAAVPSPKDAELGSVEDFFAGPLEALRRHVEDDLPPTATLEEP